MDREKRRDPRIPPERLPPRIPGGGRPPIIPPGRVPRKIPDEKALSRCGSGIRRLLKMSDDEVKKRKKEDDERIRKNIEKIKKEKPTRPGERAEREPSWDEIRDMIKPGVAKRRFNLLPHRRFGPIFIDPTEKVRIRAILDFAGNEDDLKAMGIRVNSRNNNIFTIVGTKDQIANLASQVATRSVRLPRTFYPTLQDSNPQAEIDQIHAVGTEGNGVIVGVIDSPIHVGHHSILDPNDPNHPTRLLYYWVQDPDLAAGGAQPPGQDPEAYSNDLANPNSPDFTDLDYGRIYDDAAINTALGLANTYGTGNNQIAKDHSPLNWAGNPTAEHGMHCLGIAGGSGNAAWGAAQVNIGGAPLADLVHVAYRWSHAALQNGAWEDDIINALTFIFRVSEELGRPVVISNSYGTGVGPHDGRLEFDIARNAMLDSFLGRSIVWAAGNDNDDEGFRTGTIAPGATEVFTLDPHGWNVNDNWVDIWYTGPDLDFQIDSGADSTGWVLPPNEFAGNINAYAIEVDRVLIPGSRKNIRLYINNAGSNMTINLRNNGGNDVHYRAWVGGQGGWADLTGFSIDKYTISDECCGRSILTVGACDKPVGAAPELITGYSGRGPTSDGRIKPEIVCVGDDIWSADSRTDDGYVQMGGTSMACPLVAGAVALLFEENPDLYQDAIKGMLLQTADRTDLDLNPDAAGYDELEHDAYGHGRLRMLAPFQQAMPLVDVDVWVRTAQDDYGFEPYLGGCFCHAPQVAILGPGGIQTTTLHWNDEHTVHVRVHNLGDSPAIKTRVKIKYTRPWAAPDDWKPCKDPDGNNIEQEINIPAVGFFDLEFDQKWIPKEAEVPGGDEWGNHYCILVELDHDDDPLLYEDATAAGGNPWKANIKGTNNVALRNLSIL